jgi:citrate synthase
MSDLSWTSAITEIAPNTIRLRGYPMEELMGHVSFAGVIYLALTGDLPDEPTAKLIDAIFVSSVDHGTTPPTAQTARTVASTGAPLGSAVAAGILSISRFHGGAIEDCMKAIGAGLEKAKTNSASFDDAALETVKEYKSRGQRVSGFGHRVHTADPRTKRMLDLAEELGKAGNGIAMGRALESAIATSSGRQLPMNVDGAIAAVLVDLEIAPALANAFLIIARLPGLVAHATEEQSRQRPMRKIDHSAVTYDGPPLRHL